MNQDLLDVGISKKVKEKTVIDLSENGNDGDNKWMLLTVGTDVREQSCQLTTVNGCDSVAVLNLAITQPDTSFYRYVLLLPAMRWNGRADTVSGTYNYSEQSANEFSIKF